MIDFKRLFSILFFLFVSLSSFGAYKTLHMYQSIAFDAFPSDTTYKEEPPTDTHGHHISGSYPESYPPLNPLHDDDDKFGMRCQSGSGGGYDCRITLAVDMQWNTKFLGKTKNCTITVKLQDNGNEFDHQQVYEYYVNDGSDCTVDHRKIDGVNVGVVHPKVTAGERITTVKFKGTFTDTQAATWADQIYSNLLPDLKKNLGLSNDNKTKYQLNNDKTLLTFTMPVYFEVPYTCQDWC